MIHTDFTYDLSPWLNLDIFCRPTRNSRNFPLGESRTATGMFAPDQAAREACKYGAPALPLTELINTAWTH